LRFNRKKHASVGVDVLDFGMDIERQDSRRKQELLSFKGIKDHLKEKAHHPSASGTLILFFILNLIMLIVGIIKRNECPIQKLIPIYLIVAGATGIVSKLLPFINRRINITLITYIIYTLYIFEFVCMLIGSYWVYSIYKPNFNEGIRPYCSKTAYYLAFWLLTVNWVLLAITVVLICCAIFVSAFMK